jgi:hypothetical protein
VRARVKLGSNGRPPVCISRGPRPHLLEMWPSRFLPYGFSRHITVNNDACASFSYPSERRGDRSNAVTRVKASTPPRQSHAFQDAANGLRRRHLHPCRCARPASLVSHAAEQCRRATTPDVDVLHRLPYQTHQFVIRCLWLRLVSHLDGRWFPDLSSGVLTSVDASSGSSIVVPPGLMLALGLAQRFSSVEALVKVQV